MEHKTQSLSNCEIKFKDDNRFGGYASTFGNVDSYGDTILPGAYKKTLEQNGLPKMFVQHESFGLPVGKWTKAYEDETGLYVEGEFTPGMLAADQAKAALQHETIDGLSIGYHLHKSDYKPRDKIEGGRIIANVSKLIEVSLVTFPADSFARVDMKSEIETLETIRDCERFMRESLGLSKAMAMMLIAKINSLKDRGEHEKSKVNPDFGDLIARINQINRKL